jgi:hypothetical protein
MLVTIERNLLQLNGCYIHKLQSEAYRDQNPLSITTSLFKTVISCMGGCPQLYDIYESLHIN